MRLGYTIIELLTTALIVGIVCLTGVPRAGAFVDAIQVRSAATSMTALFSAARHAAIANGTQSVLTIDEPGNSVTVALGADTLSARDFAKAYGVDISTNRNSVTYSPTGLAYGPANMSLVISRNASVDTIVVSRLGRVRH